jgi:hypothetical protein
MLSPVEPDRIDNYLRFMARYLFLFFGLPLMFGFYVKPAGLLLAVVGIDFLWHRLE